MGEITTGTKRGTSGGDTIDLSAARAPSMARVEDLKPHQRELLEMYQRARETEGRLPFPNADAERGDLVGSTGTLQMSFLLPNSETIGVTKGIGLSSPCTAPKLHDMRYSAADKGFWLRFSALNKSGNAKESMVLVYEETSGPDAVITAEKLELSKGRKELADAYDYARSNGRFTFPHAEVERGDLVGNGGLQTTFLLPNGEQIGVTKGIGLSNPCTAPKLHDMRYSAEDKGFWLRFSALNEGGQVKESMVLVYENASGADAITTAEVLELSKRREELADAYAYARRNGTFAFLNADVDHGDLVGSDGKLKETFLLPNGEQIGVFKGIGLPRACTAPKLHDMRYSPADKGFWLRFSALYKSGNVKESMVFVYENASGADAIITAEVLELSKRRKELADAYAYARSNGTFAFSNAEVERGDLVASTGQLQTTFLLPNGEQIGVRKTMGLPRSCTAPKLHDVRYSAEDKGFWLRFSALDEGGQVKESMALVYENASGSDAITTAEELGRSKRRKELADAYAYARSNGIFAFSNAEVERGDLVQSTGQLQTTFLLPNGEHIRVPKSVGLPSICTAPKLHDLRYSAEDKGFWLRFSALDEGGQVKESMALVYENASGSDAITTVEELGRSKRRKELADAYAYARSNGTFAFSNAEVERGDLVQSTGQLQTTFLLPNGEHIRAPKSVGLPSICTAPKLHDLRYSPDERGFWIKVSAVDKSGRTRFVEFLVSDDPDVKGGDAILKTRELGRPSKQQEKLPSEFRRNDPRVESRRSRRVPTVGEASSEVRMVSAPNRVTFVKGEAFEQLIGVALALKYPEERIVPQYCLKVGIDSEGKGFYGMRADYVVGDDKVVEVKWGGATSNIVETHARHTEQLRGRNFSYEVIMLEENRELTERGIPYTLFSKLVDDLTGESGSLVQETQALIARLVHEENGADLERVRDYLYGMLGDVRDGNSGEARTQKLHDALSFLILQEPAELNGFLEENARVHFNSLEASFEWNGKLYTDCINPLQYYAEHPKNYEIVYTFDASYNRCFRRLYFAEELARDLAVAQEFLCGAAETLSNAGEILRAPVFNFGNGIRVATESTLATRGIQDDVIGISSLSDLRNVLQGTGLNVSDSWFGDQVGLAEAWVANFPVRA